MTATCPDGHTSAADDYCDVCGMPIDPAAVDPQATAGATPAPAPDAPSASSAAQPAPPAADTGSGSGDPSTAAPAAAQVCPDCSTPNSVDALFCEGCGYDFTTKTSASPHATSAASSGAAPDPDAATPPPAATFEWVAEVWVDPAWYTAQQGDDPMPSPGPPVVIPLREKSLLIGRTSKSRNIHPEIDCETDSATSRRQAQLTSDGTRWWVEDLQSANGTFVGAASGALPDDPIAVGVKRELEPDDRVYVGAWTRLVIRPATADEKSTLT